MRHTIEAQELHVGDRIIANAGGTVWSQRPTVALVAADGGDHYTVTVQTPHNGRHRIRLHRYHELIVVR